jgi:hypothetical protein
MEWQKIVLASELDDCPDCGEPWCEKHQMHYADCDCLGPTQDDVEYKEIDGELYGRLNDE